MLARSQLIALVLISGVAPAALGQGAAPSIKVRARFDPGESTISGTAEFSFVNACSKPLGEVLLALYPNRLLEPNPALNDVNYSWSYPRAFDPGWIDVARIAFRPGEFRPQARISRISLPALEKPSCAWRWSLPCRRAGAWT